MAALTLASTPALTYVARAVSEHCNSGVSKKCDNTLTATVMAMTLASSVCVMRVPGKACVAVTGLQRFLLVGFASSESLLPCALKTWLSRLLSIHMICPDLRYTGLHQGKAVKL